jgi:drug/metabolite transporter (DMT)-like permease
MTLFATLLLAVVLVGNTAGQLLFKAASLRASDSGLTAHWRALASDPLLWLALTIYVFEFFMWLAFLSVVPLWQGVMIACIDILMVMVGGRIFFDEKITRSRMLAISLIAVGVLLVGGGGQ